MKGAKETNAIQIVGCRRNQTSSTVFGEDAKCMSGRSVIPVLRRDERPGSVSRQGAGWGRCSTRILSSPAKLHASPQRSCLCMLLEFQRELLASLGSLHPSVVHPLKQKRGRGHEHASASMRDAGASMPPNVPRIWRCPESVTEKKVTETQA